jgi:hypothetical protein
MRCKDQLFASMLTLGAVEAQLLIMAHTLGNFTPMLHRSLPHVDWSGWAALHYMLRNGIWPSCGDGSRGGSRSGNDSAAGGGVRRFWRVAAPALAAMVDPDGCLSGSEKIKSPTTAFRL